ncbi:thiamine pyrophosphate-dependent enzyme [Bacteroidota bacterium]
MEKLLLLGDEAIAQGSIDAGLSGIYAYPGTPSTEITEYVQRSKLAKERGIHSDWSANEKTAMETALGMSYTGKRAMVCMKHVGLNVASDPFINSAITGANGGLIVVVADDPSMHSSQNEQDSRFYGKFAMIPIFEPSNQQEAYDMAYEGFKLSEKYEIPIMIRLTTRLAHSRAGVKRSALKEQNKISLPKDMRQFVLLPSIARERYKILLDNQAKFEKESEQSVYNKYIEGKDKSMGIVACGIAYNYLMENYGDGKCPFPIFKISQYPLPLKLITKITSECKKILVLEDGYPFVEDMINGILDKDLIVLGRTNGAIPRDGELNPNIVAEAIGKPIKKGKDVPGLVVGRPPSLCSGCPHIDSFDALNEALEEYGKGRVFSDIGCYTLSALPPYESINSCVDMGASVTMAKGAADAGLKPSVAVIGDSTFTHSGITGLLDAVNENSPITVIILDNSTTAMTGGQNSHATGRLENICLGIGVKPEHLKILNPLKKHHEENVKIIKDELAYNGISVIIPTRDCIEIIKKTKKPTKETEK